jgi:preprotein translocase SecE subunit
MGLTICNSRFFKLRSNQVAKQSRQNQEDESARVVRRVSAKTDTNKRPAAKKPQQKKAAAPKKHIKLTGILILLTPFFAIGRYFRNSWRELRQVRWPNRRSAWSLTLAVILFTGLFAGLILLFDWIFNYVIQEVIL